MPLTLRYPPDAPGISLPQERRRAAPREETRLPRYVGALDQGRPAPGSWCSTRGREVARHQLEHAPDPARAGLGRARSDRDCRARRRRHRRRACDAAGLTGRTLRRSASPTSARRRSCGIRRPGVRGTTRSSGRTRGPTATSARARAAARESLSASAPACRRRHISRRRSCGGSRSRRRRARRRRARRGGLRHDRHLGDLEPDRRPDGGLHVTDVTNASRTQLMNLRTLAVGRRAARSLRHPAAHAAARSARHRRRRVRRDTIGRAARRRGSDRRQPRRSAGGARSARRASRPAKRRTPTAPATSCCSTPAIEIVPSHAGLLTTVGIQFDGDADRLRAGRIDRRHRRRGAVAARPARDDPTAAEIEALAASRRRTTAASISCPRSRACSRHTGVRTRAARSSACRGFNTRRTSRARRSKRSASRRATCSTRWRRTPACALDGAQGRRRRHASTTC